MNLIEFSILGILLLLCVTAGCLALFILIVEIDEENN